MSQKTTQFLKYIRKIRTTAHFLNESNEIIFLNYRQTEYLLFCLLLCMYMYFENSKNIFGALLSKSWPHKPCLWIRQLEILSSAYMILGLNFLLKTCLYFYVTVLIQSMCCFIMYWVLSSFKNKYFMSLTHNK